MKVDFIHRLGGLKSRAFAEVDGLYIKQEFGDPISDAEYAALELPYGIKPQEGQIYSVEIDGKKYLISDLSPIISARTRTAISA